MHQPPHITMYGCARSPFGLWCLTCRAFRHAKLSRRTMTGSNTQRREALARLNEVQSWAASARSTLKEGGVALSGLHIGQCRRALDEAQCAFEAFRLASSRR